MPFSSLENLFLHMLGTFLAVSPPFEIALCWREPSLPRPGPIPRGSKNSVTIQWKSIIASVTSPKELSEALLYLHCSPASPTFPPLCIPSHTDVKILKTLSKNLLHSNLHPRVCFWETWPTTNLNYCPAMRMGNKSN